MLSNSVVGYFTTFSAKFIFVVHPQRIIENACPRININGISQDFPIESLNHRNMEG
eukprot:TRINITY_DN247_c0_g1_i1.p3 TRINITY_DN247_c0_g1~~TRINITY_DN247_c0_g1_i1.p3  ORF type:complete len:56 (-),score=9.15 TRINITY_DN247_c0_g1_i1:97-264(-)